MTKVKIVVYAPIANADKIRKALGSAEAGLIGEYRFCSYSITGKGRFIPLATANPHIGKAKRIETVKEECIEVVCERSKAKKTIEAVRRVHPYEKPVIDIYPLISEDEL